MGQLVRGDGEVRYLSKVDVGELLQRDRRSLQIAKIAEFLEGKRVMVTRCASLVSERTRGRGAFANGGLILSKDAGWRTA